MKQIKAAIISIAATSLSDEEKRLLAAHRPLGVSLFARNIENPEQLKTLTQGIRNAVETDDRLIVIDQEGGRVCRLKHPLWRKYMSQATIGALQEALSVKAAELHARLIADDLHLVGINCNFAPTLDVGTPDITAALKSRCFSYDEKLTARLGQVMFDAYNQAGIVPCIKHFSGHSGARNDPHLQLSIISKTNRRYFYPFAQIAPQALMGMTAHIVLQEFDSLPITMSARVIRSLIREEFGFKGLLVSDALEMRALSGSLAEKTQAAIMAGCNAALYCKGDIDGLRTVLDNCGYISEENRETLQRIFALTHRPYASENIESMDAEYANYAAQAPEIVDDYDAVEVLNKL